MQNIIDLIKKLLFSLLFDLDDLPELAENLPDSNIEKEKTNAISTTSFYIKKLILIGIVLGMFGVTYLYLSSEVPDLDKLQKLLDQLMLITDFDLFSDIYLNAQKIILRAENSENLLFMLKEIHKFFINDTSSIKDSAQFDKIMKKIIELLSKIK